MKETHISETCVMWKINTTETCVQNKVPRAHDTFTFNVSFE